MIDIVNIKKCNQFTFVTNYQSIGLRERIQKMIRYAKKVCRLKCRRYVFFRTTGILFSMFFRETREVSTKRCNMQLQFLVNWDFINFN